MKPSGETNWGRGDLPILSLASSSMNIVNKRMPNDAPLLLFNNDRSAPRSVTPTSSDCKKAEWLEGSIVREEHPWLLLVSLNSFIVIVLMKWYVYEIYINILENDKWIHCLYVFLSLPVVFVCAFILFIFLFIYLQCVFVAFP